MNPESDQEYRVDYSKAYQKEWPAIKQKPNLQVKSPSNNKDHIYTIESFLSPSECLELRTAFLKKQPLDVSSHAQTRATAFRDNDRSAFHAPALSNIMWNSSGLKELFESCPALCHIGKKLRPFGLNDNWRLYRYRPGQRFGPHYDEEAEGEGLQEGVFTLLIYLSGRLEGGETVFYRGTSRTKKLVVSVPPTTGMALLHAQGSRCLLHEGAIVKSGLKWVLRSDVMYTPC
ncbi:hypothetical protein DFS34DRAFT_578325 [Phlyctochytrium arcticum]|nr:hypothetical protein DFS34DRAFT_578325 [Phlyctochytrium arcticum]